MPIANMASAFTKNSDLLSNGINTNKDAHCSYCKDRAISTKVSPNSKRKKNWRIKMAKSPSVKLTQNAQPAGKRTTPLNVAGKGQGTSTSQKDTLWLQGRWYLRRRKGIQEVKYHRNKHFGPINFSQKRFKKLILPQLQICNQMPIRQYVIPDPPNVIYKQSQYDTTWAPSTVWQQQIDNARNKTQQIIHSDYPQLYPLTNYNQNSETKSRPLQTIDDYNHQYYDTEYGKDPYGRWLIR